jgi:hypothetical protein
MVKDGVYNSLLGISVVQRKQQHTLPLHVTNVLIYSLSSLVFDSVSARFLRIQWFPSR